MNTKAALSLTSATIAIGASCNAYADDVEDVIIVTGIRASTQEPLDTK